MVRDWDNGDGMERCKYSENPRLIATETKNLGGRKPRKLCVEFGIHNQEADKAEMITGFCVEKPSYYLERSGREFYGYSTKVVFESPRAAGVRDIRHRSINPLLIKHQTTGYPRALQ